MPKAARPLLRAASNPPASARRRFSKPSCSNSDWPRNHVTGRHCLQLRRFFFGLVFCATPLHLSRSFSRAPHTTYTAATATPGSFSLSTHVSAKRKRSTRLAMACRNNDGEEDPLVVVASYTRCVCVPDTGRRTSWLPARICSWGYVCRGSLDLERASHESLCASSLWHRASFQTEDRASSRVHMHSLVKEQKKIVAVEVGQRVLCSLSDLIQI